LSIIERPCPSISTAELRSNALLITTKIELSNGLANSEAMEGPLDHVGWDLKSLGTLPFMTWVCMEIDYVKPVRADQEIPITSFVREFRGPERRLR
jgi:hypothetical protein